MARCLAPITIKNPADYGKRQLQFLPKLQTLSRYGRDNLRPILSDALVVPCGKCLNCLKNKQSSMAVLCLREAEKRGSFAFMTLTYDDDHTPLTESMWRVDLKTGIEEQVESAEFVSTGFHPEPAYLKMFDSGKFPGTPKPRYVMFEHCTILNWQWQVRITPSVCRKDVRQWLKQARIQYQRDHGEKLPDFSYVAVSEYGPRICRPHYHLAFFGLQREHLNYLLDAWRFGKVKQFRMVMHINADKKHSNGFLRASQYIGKYMSKGKFECDSVCSKDAEKPRVCRSLHFGTCDLEPLANFVLCKDMVGEYDQSTLLRPDGTPLSRLQVESLQREIPKRLCYRVDDDNVFPIPRVMRDKIFKIKDDETGKKVSSTLWTLVAAAIRDESQADRDRQFEEFCSLHPERTHTENAALFADFEAFAASVEESVVREDIQGFYAHSQF